MKSSCRNVIAFVRFCAVSRIVSPHVVRVPGTITVGSLNGGRRPGIVIIALR